MLVKYITSIILLINLLACNKVVDNSNPEGKDASGEWLINKSEVFDGGPGKDGIPALEYPDFNSVNSSSYLFDDDLVIVVKAGDNVKVYPHRILDWHEIINDGIGDFKYAITYCPLTGSGISYNRVIHGKATTFGVSGLLYNTNLIPYDRETGSNWSQMKLQCVNGKLIRTNIAILPIVETKFRTVKQLYPDAKVVSTTTGYNRRYDLYPYGDYKVNNSSLIFPVSNEDFRLPFKERVLGVILDNSFAAFKFEENDSLILKRQQISGVEIVNISSKKYDINVAFVSKLNGKRVNLDLLQGKFPTILKDNIGNEYNFFGEIVTGSDEGKKLAKPTQFISYWFAWAAFYPETELH